MFENPVTASWSDNRIALHVGVSHTFVAKVRGEVSCNGCKIEERSVVRNGTEYTQNTAPIGSQKAPDSAPEFDDELGDMSIPDDPDAEPEAGPWQGISEPMENPQAPAPSEAATTKAASAEPVGEIMADGGTVFYKDDASIRDDEVFDEEESEAAPVGESELEDNAWVDSLPLASILRPFPGFLTFSADAIAWRNCQKSGLQGKVKYQFDAAARSADNITRTRGPFLSLLKDVSRALHPREWVLCPSCRGCGQYWMNKTNKQHEAAGTVEPNSSNEFALRCTKMKCERCEGGYNLP
jgi:hypothetical protein